MWVLTSMLHILFDGTVLRHRYSSAAHPLVGVFNRYLPSTVKVTES
jgi:hypothetical protein